MEASISKYFIMGSLGVLLQICLRIKQLQNKSKIANHPFSFKDYFKDDAVTIIGSFITVGILIYGLDELKHFKPEIADYIMWLFAFVGFTGSSIIQSVFSVYSRKLNSVLDIKTNAADGIEPSVDGGNQDGVAEIKKEDINANIPYSAPKDPSVNK